LSLGLRLTGNDSSWANTLVIVTGDHETGYLTGGPGFFPQFGLGGAVGTAARIANEKVISGTQRRASWDDANNNDLIDPGEAVYWMWNSGQHTNMLAPLYARGAGATRIASYANANDLIRGAYLDNTDVFHLMDRAIRTKVIDQVKAGSSYPIADLVIGIDPDGLGNIAYLEVLSYTQDHPDATHEGLQTGHYWSIAAKTIGGQPATDFTATLTITVDFMPGEQDKLCRYTGSGWDCGLPAEHTFNVANNTITRHNITQFSEWTVGRSVGPTAVSLANIGVDTAVPTGLLLILLVVVGTAVALTAVGLLRGRLKTSKHSSPPRQ
jgi:hypothetical protein